MRLTNIFLFLLIISACGPTIIEEHDENGILIAAYEIRNNQKHGRYTAFHPNGSNFEKATYINGEIHGIRLLYRETGELQTTETYERGIMQGMFEDYHLNGKIALTGMYVDNAMDGVWKKYNEKGEILEEVTFKNNEENGPFKEYHNNGSLAAEGAYLNGDNEHGLLKIYNEQGQLIKEMDCDNGICRTKWSKENSK